MAKKKNKKGKKSAVYKALKPILRDNRVLLAVLAAAAGGVALAAVIGSDRGKQVIDGLSDSVKDLMQPNKNGQATQANTVVRKPSPAPAT
jgi:membrane protease subunit (stomatin/prohibitin family)